MLGRKPTQGSLFAADNLYREHVGADSIYAGLAELRPLYFPDSKFADLYREGGRPSVPPSQLCVLLILQYLHNVSDREAVNRSAFDLRWKVALGLEADETLCAKSTVQWFRAQLVLNEKYGDLLTSSVQACRDAGLLKRAKLEVAIDSTPILGRGAVKDTYNLVSDQIRRVVKAVVEITGEDLDAVIEGHGLGCHFGSSFKGEAEIDWSSPEERRALVGELVRDARAVLQLGQAALKECADGAHRDALAAGCELLRQLLQQDVEEAVDDGKGPRIRTGTAKDRVISTTDPEMRHGRKTSTKTVNGYKATVVADTTSGTILATTVAPANQHDGACAREAVEQALDRTEEGIERCTGDTAYGTTKARAEVESLGVSVTAKAPPAGGKLGCFSIDEFKIDAERDVATCPAGKESAPARCATRSGIPGKRYEFAAQDCATCPLRAQCTTAKGARSIVVTEVTRALQVHREEQKTEAFKEIYRRRVAIEHRIARLIQLGARQARYCGKAKVAFQLAITAVVANLTAAMAAQAANLAACLIACMTPRRLLAGLRSPSTHDVRHLPGDRPVRQRPTPRAVNNFPLTLLGQATGGFAEKPPFRPPF